MVLCQAITHHGLQCTRSGSNGSSYCWQHIYLAERDSPVTGFEHLSLGRFRLPPLRVLLLGAPTSRTVSTEFSEQLISGTQSPPGAMVSIWPNSPPRIALPTRPNSPPRIGLPTRPNSPPRIGLPARPNSTRSTRLTIETNPPMVDKDGQIHQMNKDNDFPDHVSDGLYVYLRDRNFATSGDDSELYHRIIEIQRRGSTPYRLLTMCRLLSPKGNYISQETVSNNRGKTGSTMQVRMLQYGQSLGRGVLGEKEYVLERQPYDLELELEHQMQVATEITPVLKDSSQLEYLCKPVYLTDPVTLEALADIQDLQQIYVDQSQRCFYIPTILAMWEADFSSYDHISNRIVPSYPKDVHNKYLHPITIVSVYHTARYRGLDVSRYPLLGLLVEHNDLLLDISRFIRGYRRITAKYDKLHQLYPQDLGIWNRRDLLAGTLLGDIYDRYNIPVYGTRKYDHYSIPSGPGLNGTQIYYQPLLIAFFIRHGYSISEGQLQWSRHKHTEGQSSRAIRPFLLTLSVV